MRSRAGYVLENLAGTAFIMLVVFVVVAYFVIHAAPAFDFLPH